MSWSSDAEIPQPSNPGLVRRASKRLREVADEKKAAAPACRLSWNYVGREAGWNLCGHFTSKRRWLVETGGRSGVIVQHITRTFNIRKCDNPNELVIANRTWSALLAGQIDGYCNNPDYRTYDDCLTYWEAWEVAAGGNVRGNPDELSLCSIIPDGDESRALYSTQGSYSVSGTASFYPGISLEDLARDHGFSQQSDHPAGVLYSTNTDPGDLGVTGYAGDPFTVTSTWDSAKNNAADCESDVAES